MDLKKKKNKPQLHAAYERLSSAVRTHTGSKKWDGNGYWMQVEIKREQR